VIKLRRVRLEGYVAHIGKMRNLYKILVGRPQGKELLGRLRHRSQGNFKMFYREIVNQASSVSIVIGCRLDDWGLILGRGKYFSPHQHVHTSSGAQPASSPLDTWGKVAGP
jgi:hypothetical protein